eukprot:629617-Rhodomonas_salina.4
MSVRGIERMPSTRHRDRCRILFVLTRAGSGKEVALAKETELTKKATELEKALSEQRTAAQAIKDASGDAATLSQAKAGLEGKIKELEGVIASMSTASSTDTNKVRPPSLLFLSPPCIALPPPSLALALTLCRQVGALEAELEAMKGKLSAEKEAQRLVVKLRQEKVLSAFSTPRTLQVQRGLKLKCGARVAGGAEAAAGGGQEQRLPPSADRLDPAGSGHLQTHTHRRLRSHTHTDTHTSSLSFHTLCAPSSGVLHTVLRRHAYLPMASCIPCYA